MAQLVGREFKEKQGNKVNLVFKVNVDWMEVREKLVTLVSEVRKEKLVWLEPQGNKVNVVWLETRGNKVPLVLQVRLVLQDKMVLKEKQDTLELRVQLDNKVIQVRRD